MKVVADMINLTGHKRAILKSDGGSSLSVLKDAVKTTCEVNIGVEVSPAGDSQANGEIKPQFEDCILYLK